MVFFIMACNRKNIKAQVVTNYVLPIFPIFIEKLFCCVPSVPVSLFQLLTGYSVPHKTSIDLI